MKPRTDSVVPGLIAIIAMACSAADDRPSSFAGSPILHLADTVLLQESDSAFLGQLMVTFAVDSNGTMYIGDQGLNRLLVFNSDGRLRRIIGRFGKGPGEFSDVGFVTLFRDSVLLQSSGARTLSLLRERDGIELKRIVHPGFVSRGAATKDHIVLGDFERLAGSAVILVSWDSLLRTPDPVRLVPNSVTTPSLYSQFRELLIFNSVPVAAKSDTLVVGFGVGDFILHIDPSGQIVDTIWTPVRLRRGTPPTVLPRYRNPRISFHDAISGVSGLRAMWFTRTGHLVLWFEDGSTEDPSRVNSPTTGVAYLAVITPDLGRACVDASLEAPGTRRTRLSFGRDTLYSLDQFVDSSAADPQVRTVIRKYSIHLANCEWLTTADRPRY